MTLKLPTKNIKITQKLAFFLIFFTKFINFSIFSTFVHQIFLKVLNSYTLFVFNIFNELSFSIKSPQILLLKATRESSRLLLNILLADLLSAGLISYNFEALTSFRTRFSVILLTRRLIRSTFVSFQ
jgi:hypothetical protein